jgi:hypothetical protein
MICCAVFRAMFKTLKISLFFATLLISSTSWCQQFDVTLTHQNTYTSDDPAIFREFINCKSVNSGKTVSIGTVDGASGPLRWFFNEIDSAGQIDSLNCLEIEASPNTSSIIIMDIKPLLSNSGYVACGYHFLNSMPNILKPLSILLNNAGVPQKCYTYFDSGIFTRVIESPKGDFIFVGAKGNSTFIKNANRTAFIVKAYPSLIEKFYITIPGVVSAESYDLINDLAMKSDDSLIVAGSITGFCNAGAGLKAQSVLMCLNPNNGVIHWQQNLFSTNYVSPKVTIVNDTLYTVFNAGPPNRAAFCVVSAINGTLLGGRQIKLDAVINCQNNLINTDTMLFQSLIVRSNRIFLSGKVIHQSGQFPFDIDFAKSTYFIHYSNIYFNKYKSPNFDGMSYSNYRIGTGCLTGSAILPLFSVNSSTMNSFDTISTIAATTFADSLVGPFYSYFPWSYTNNYSIITGKNSATVNISSLPSTSSATLTVQTPGIRQWTDFNLIHTVHPVKQNGCQNHKTPCDCNH